MSLIEAAITGGVSVSVAGLTSTTLSAFNGQPDQARCLYQQYTGALTGDCTVTLPNVAKFGWAQNSTTGSHNIILTAGAGTTATIPPDAKFYYYEADGGTNVTLPSVGFGNVTSAGAAKVTSGGLTITAGGLTISAGGAAITGSSSVTGALTVSTSGTSSTQVVNFSQFNPTTAALGCIDLPNGVTLQWGNGTGPSAAVSFKKSFSSNPWIVLPVVAAVAAGGATGYAQVTTTVSSSGCTIVTVSSAGVGVTLQFYYLAIGPT